MSKRIALDTKKLTARIGKHVGGYLVKQAQKGMDTLSYGRRYRIGGKIHIASKEGDAPNNLSYHLRATIRWKTAPMELHFGSGNRQVRYARHLETKMNRPNIPVVVENNIRHIKALFQKQIKPCIIEK